MAPESESWDGMERRGELGELVARAAAMAAQHVARIHRRRLVMQAFLAALITATAISLPVTVIINDQRVAQARENSRLNCQQAKAYADVFRDFASSDARLRFRQQHYAQRAKVLTAFSKIIEPKLLKQLTTRSQRIDRDTTRYWKKTLIPRLDHLAAINCVKALR